ncbi:SMC family ATPase [Candidatus Bipolaricaulota bacterium]|nr:SMC family ATPase [Candidatus Bipolaricaulota bacterium]
MKIRKLELKNFRCFEEQAFEFPDGLIGILGPNGSGKSTILEALSWSLYGSSAIRTKRADLRLDSASGSDTCRVTLEFELDGETYELERRMTGKSLSPRAYITNSEERLVESFQGVTQYVEEKLLRMTESSFFRSVFSKQNEVRELSSGGPEERRQLFAKLLDIDRIKAARREVDGDARDKRQRAEALEEQLGNLEKLKKNLQSKESEAKELTKGATSLEEELRELNKKIDNKETDFQKLEGQKDNLTELEKKRENLRARMKNLQGNIKERETELEELQKKRDQAEKLSKFAEKYEKLECRKDDLEKKKDRYRDKEDIKSRLGSREEDLAEERDNLETTEKNLREYNRVRDKLKKKKAKKNEKDEKITNLKARKAEIEGSIEKHKSDLEELQEKMENVEDLGAEGECPVCKRSLGDDYDTVIRHYNQEIDKVKEDINKLQKENVEVSKDLEKAIEKKKKLNEVIEDLEDKNHKRTSLTDRRDDLRGRIKNLEAVCEELEEELKEIGEVDFEDGEYQEVKRELKNLEDDYHTYKNLRAEIKRIPDVEEILSELADKLKSVKTELKKVKEQIESLDFNEKEFRELKEDLKELRAKKDRVKDKYTKESKKLAELKTEINHLKEEIDREEGKREKLDGLREERLLLDRVSTYFDQFRLDLLNRIRPVLSRRASDLLEKTTDGRYSKLTIDEDYLVRVFEDGTPYPLDRFSGGETDLANLCLRVAISEFVAGRSGRPINFIVLDEVFGSQDQQRRQNILKSLRNLDDLFYQIFLITHSEEVKDRLDNVFLLSRENHDTTSVKSFV